MLTIWMSLHAHYMTQLQQQQSKESFDINAALSIGEVEKLTYLIRLLKNSKACVCVIYTASGQIDPTKKWISVS